MQTRRNIIAAMLLLLSMPTAKAQINLKQKAALINQMQVMPLKGDSLTNSFLVVITDSVKLHKHLYHSEHIYVLAGHAEMHLGDSIFTISASDYVFIPQNTPHKAIRKGKEPLKVLSIQAPAFDGTDRILLE